MPNLLSIITVNFNGLSNTIELIDSIKKNILTIDYEIIVVDNGSKDDESIPLKKAYPWVKAIRLNDNLGFAGGNNVGIKSASGEYIFLLNNDTVIVDDTLKFLINRLKEDKHLGAISPKILFHAPPQRVQFAGYTSLKKITLRNNIIGYNKDDAPEYNIARKTPFAHGAAMMLTREVIEQVGLMAELYFLYYEELDWSEMITRKGYYIQFDPRCKIYHKESSSTGVGSPLICYYMTRNRLIYVLRNRTGLSKLIAVLYQLVFINPYKIAMDLFAGRTTRAYARLKGVIDFCRGKYGRQWGN